MAMRAGTIAIALVILIGAVCAAVAVQQHVVGEDRGWDRLSDFNGWASRKTFRVGDNLWFKYSSAEQGVAEVKSQEEWQACNISNAIRMYSGGLDSVPLLQAGTRYFTSGSIEDCQNGMKLHVDVVVSENKSSSSANSDAIRVAEGPTSGAPISLSLFSWIALCSICCSRLLIALF